MAARVAADVPVAAAADAVADAGDEADAASAVAVVHEFDAVGVAADAASMALPAVFALLVVATAAQASPPPAARLTRAPDHVQPATSACQTDLQFLVIRRTAVAKHIV